MIKYFGITHLLLIFLLAWPAHAIVVPERPEPGSFIQDTQNLISFEHKIKIQNILTKLNSEQEIPIIVVTIDSLLSYTDGEYLGIEEYSRRLFNHWGIGHHNHNYGVLFLVSKEDQLARIQFGGGWGFLYDGKAQTIMDEVIVSRFKAGKYSEGIKAGIIELDQLARTDLVYLIDEQKIVLMLFIFAALATVMTMLMKGNVHQKQMTYQRYYAGAIGLFYIFTYLLHWIGLFNHIEIHIIFAGYVTLTFISLAFYAFVYARSRSLADVLVHILLLIVMMVFIPVALMMILFKVNESDDEFNGGDADFGGGATGSW